MLPNTAIDHASDLNKTQKDLFHILCSNAHNETREVTIGVDILCARLGRGERTTQVAMAVLIESGRVLRIPSLFGWHTYRIVSYVRTKPVENNAENCTPPPAENCTPLINTVEALNTLKAEPPLTPHGGSGVCISRKSVSSWPKPNPEARQAEAEARQVRQELRAARSRRKTASRTAHYAAVRDRSSLGQRSRRHHEAQLTPAQKAAVEVLALCGVVESNWRLRDAIAAAMELAIRHNGGTPLRLVEGMVLAWGVYLDDSDVLRCPVGMERFFTDGLWCNRKLWRYDEEKLKKWRDRF
jgi:hypothetical protein